ncbi:MAG TPA: hypothetical protein VHS09_01110, partial [Polyangiaceae bacterium]|nr:hypothetical protein [Polyangiaceae bacterium]
MQRRPDPERRRTATALVALAVALAGCSDGSTGQLSLHSFGKGGGSEPPSGGAPSGMGTGVQGQSSGT